MFLPRIRIGLTMLVAFAAVALGGCAAEVAKFKAEIATASQIYTLATTATVPAEVVRPAANAFDILKGTAANFAQYCNDNNETPVGCDVDTRRKISMAVKAGTSARVQLRASLKTGQPALSTVYNLMVNALNDLKSTPVATFTGAK